MERGRFANVSQCFITGIMENWRIGNGQTGIYGIDPIAISVVMYYYDCAATASLILSVGNGRQGRGAYIIMFKICNSYIIILARRGTCSATGQSENGNVERVIIRIIYLCNFCPV